METKENIHINGTKKKGHAGAILLTICIVILIGVAAFLGYMYYKEKQKVEHATEENTTYKAQVEELNTKVSSLEEDKKNLEESKNESKKTTVAFDLNKALNTTGSEYRLRDELFGINVSLENDGKVYIFTYETKENLKSRFSLDANDAFFKKTSDNDITKFEITGFSKKVKDIFVNGVGQSVSYPVILFLMEDGTVEFLNTKAALTTLNFKSAGTLKDMKDVVRIRTCDAGKGPGSGRGILAIKADGSFYNVVTVLDKMGIQYN